MPAMPTSTSKSSNLSPRQLFQNSVRELSSEDIRRHKRNKSIHLKYNPYELQHVSSLRVSPPRRSPYRAPAATLRKVAEEPDFGAAERDIWSSSSPARKIPSSLDNNFVVHEDETASPRRAESLESLLPTLRPQSVISVDADERPKTSRGTNQPSALLVMTNAADDEDDKGSEHSVRGPKFKEGTMNSRSGPVSSTWSEFDYVTSSSEAEDSDSDATPKAVRDRRSDSFDLRDFQPPALTPSAIKRTIFGRREVKKDKKPDAVVERKQPQKQEDEEKKPKKRLRKSMSKLHFLGEKMKIFGSSTQDLPDQPSRNARPLAQKDQVVLDERKRKAEAAYAEQFGTKKQRDNSGQANLTSSPEMTEPRTLPGNQKYDSSTVRHRGGNTHSRRISTGSMLNEESMSRRSSVSEHDIRKRPTRRELEKENQQLRALLRESHVARDDTEQEQTMPYIADAEAIPPVPPLIIRRSYVAAPQEQTVKEPQPAIDQHAVGQAPPVPPQHPDRRILGNVSNNRGRRARRESFGIVSDDKPVEQENTSSWSNSLQNIPKLVPTPPEKTSMAPRRSMSALPRSVSMIVEEPEYDAEDKKRSLRSRAATVGKENASLAATIEGGGRREEWQWPDDVF